MVIPLLKDIQFLTLKITIPSACFKKQHKQFETFQIEVKWQEPQALKEKCCARKKCNKI